MDTKEIREINRQRLARWARTLTAEHATAVVVVGVGHDHASGSLHLCVPDDDDVTPEFVVGVLRWALSHIEGDDYEVVKVKGPNGPVL